MAMRCSACGALVGEKMPSCPYCGASLARVACSNCFGVVPVDGKFCPSCGTPLTLEVVSQTTEINCPSCKKKLGSTSLGDININDCTSCGGAWLCREMFETLGADREKRGLVLMGICSKAGSSVPEASISYRPCPECGKLMNRINYARISGVIIDVCKPHGVWFDYGELRKVLSFIEKGGLIRAQERERMRLYEAQRETKFAMAGQGRDLFAEPREVFGKTPADSLSATRLFKDLASLFRR